ncbi:PD-(D/E)XK nuclease family protein [Candidatus Babeliales bacterium]|nr:PD-(D/E)XK nuclease family protein [Candidatus Babeliales bacterium]MBP9843733.1 PD-(D/E)XK nuclease family protein [Candidatus Babeliales bacterium]
MSIQQAAISLSWTSLSLFLECPRCFYKVQVLNKKRPKVDADSFALNQAVDFLWKREFDLYREEQAPHPIMVQYKIDALPLQYVSLQKWRDYKLGGIRFVHQDYNIELFGVIDDLWINHKNEIIVVDYKATVKHSQFMTYTTRTKWTEGNERQMSFYAYLFKQNKFLVHNKGYFIYSAARKHAEFFNQRLDFESTIVPCPIDDLWIEITLQGIRSCLSQSYLPKAALGCEFCGYDVTSGVIYEN